MTVQPNFATKNTESSPDYGKFELSPLPYGFGQSMGNALRRVLLSSIPGYAVTYVKINDVTHAFTTIEGVRDSVLDILLNIKSLRFKATGKGPFTMTLSVKGKSKVTGKDFKSSDVEVINKDQLIADITTDKAKLDITLTIEKGTAYSPSEEKEVKEIGLIPLDSIFSPVVRVNFRVDGARVGRVSNFDTLTLEIWTDSTIEPESALHSASDTLASFFTHIASGSEGSTESSDSLGSTAPRKQVDEKVYETIIDELDLPTRVVNALLREGIETVGDLVQTGKEPLVDLKGVGRKSLDLIEVELKKLGVSFND